ncbi:S-cell enriched with leucine-rich repeat-containing protein [Actinidia chinensis var. chinensis]|uniref:S-cell enriched with leucine-rich repeat-containing protein n=1 Tax=Actinidia chinensis var. chinensis TaxID=1590841 RepID=A0A2R6QF21_ACTCC|nr:S-cell enriched with leucine-rich repeat-containing protein [Actinidia chinensis var. chinensis]
MSRNEIAKNINDHGMVLDDLKRRVECNYCGKVVSGFTRLKCHLGGIRGDVAPCEEVPTDVKGLMRNRLLEKKRGNLSKEVGELYHPDLPLKRIWCPHSNCVKNAEQDMVQPVESGGKKHVKFNSISENSVLEVFSFPKGNICSQAAPSAMEELSSHQFQKCIARFFYETGIDFSAAKSPSFQRMVNATLDCGHIEFKIPSCRELKGWIFQDEVKEMQHFFDEVIMEVGADNVVQIITYFTSACMEAVGKQLMEKHRTIFWTVSASHCLQLMLEKMGMIDLIKGILEKTKTITKFIYSHATVLKLMRNHTCGCDLIKPSKIRSAMPSLTLENIVSEKENLGEMFVSSEWSTSIWASSREGKEVADLVADRSFWTGATVVLKATILLVRVLYLIHEDDKPLLGYIYETINQAKETIKDEFKNKKAQYTPFWNAIDEIWNNHLHSPLHSAGYFLNPSLFYSSDFFTDAEVASGLLCCIVRMVEGKHVQDLVSLQVDEYRAANGHFGQGSTFDRRSSTSPGHCPELQRLAIRILSQTCDGASRYQLKRSLAEKLLTKGRNYIEQQRLNDLTFVHYNLQLRNFESGVSSDILAEDIDPMDDWIVDEAQDHVVLENWLTNVTVAKGKGVVNGFQMGFRFEVVRVIGDDHITGTMIGKRLGRGNDGYVVVGSSEERREEIVLTEKGKRQAAVISRG